MRGIQTLVVGLFLLVSNQAKAVLVEGLPGEEYRPSPHLNSTPVLKPVLQDSGRGVNWLAPSIEEQLSRDRTLIALGKGAVFLPSFSESRREPEIGVFNHKGKLVAAGQTGQRILLDSGEYEVRFGSGVSGRRQSAPVKIREGQTTVVAATWGALLVETQNENGSFIDGQYEILRMSRWINYGRGNGFKEERSQDIRVWVLPPGLYRISKVGESYNSLRNFITLQINPGELHTVELIFKESTGDLIAGGVKSLNAQTKAGRNWNYGMRAGGNLGLTQKVDETKLRSQSALVSTDLRTRARFDNPQYFGTNELFFQNSFLKEKGKPFSATLDEAQLRTTWVKRLNSWVGPYIRGQATSHLFSSKSDLDTIYILQSRRDSTGTLRLDSLIDTSGSFLIKPSFFPLQLAQGVGVNIEWLARYDLELSTQIGLASRQNLSKEDYLARTSNTFERAQTTSIIGVEGILNGKLRLSSYLTLDLRAEIFSENAQLKVIQLEKIETDLRFFLSRYIEIGYLFKIEEKQNVANRYPRLHSVSLRLAFNY